MPRLIKTLKKAMLLNTKDPDPPKKKKKKSAKLKDSRRLAAPFKPSSKAQKVLDAATLERASRRGTRATGGRVLANLGTKIRTVGRARQAASDLRAENRRSQAKKKRKR